MKKTILSVAAAAALASAAMVQPASAQWWVAPVIIGSVVAGGAAVAVASNAGYANPGAYEPRGTVYVQPTGTACHIQREQLPSGRWARVRVCD